MDLETRRRYVESLRREFMRSTEEHTPEDVKKHPILDLGHSGEMIFRLTKEVIAQHRLDAWLENYRREASHSTGGIRGPQNILYYWDTRFPLNQLGVMLATVAKALVLKEHYPGKELHKIVSGEVRYHTDQYIELIARLEAAQGIIAHLPKIRRTPIWMASFLIFMHDYDGGEYVTSSHAVSSKIATKDLENEGGQFLPEMSFAFVEKIAQILRDAKASPNGYEIRLAARDDPRIRRDFDGFDLYADYLRKGVASPMNLGLIRKAAASGLRLMFDTVGGCMYQNMPALFERLGIPDLFDWHNSEEDPFFHGVGKTRRANPVTKQEEFFDLSCDVSLPEVVRTMGYDLFLKGKERGYPVLITDPDGDRLIAGQVEDASHSDFLKEMGAICVRIDEEKILAIYHPAFTFLLLMDFHMRQLKAAGKWSDHPRFIVTTAPSPRSWDEWADANNIHTVHTPVGIKEIAAIMKKVERQLHDAPAKEIVVEDVFGRRVNLGKNPRLVFGGEESGGMIMGPEEMIKSRGGRQALAMRDKSAGEASVIALALLAHLYLEKKTLSQHVQDVFNEYGIAYRHYARADITYYNESEPDPLKMNQAKIEGEVLRDRIDLFYLGLALGLREKIITMDQARSILSEAMPTLEFRDLENVFFVGDASYFAFQKMFIEIRKSGTDAKLRGYANGDDKARCSKYLDAMVYYSGNLTPLYRKYIPEDFRVMLYDQQKKLYQEYLYKGL